jgi:hypothetical protein
MSGTSTGIQALLIIKAADRRKIRNAKRLRWQTRYDETYYRADSLKKWSTKNELPR